MEKTRKGEGRRGMIQGGGRIRGDDRGRKEGEGKGKRN